MRLDYKDFNVCFFHLFLKIPQTRRKRNLLALRKSPKSPKTVFTIWNSQKVRLSISLLVVEICVFVLSCLKHFSSWPTVTSCFMESLTELLWNSAGVFALTVVCLRILLEFRSGKSEMGSRLGFRLGTSPVAELKNGISLYLEEKGTLCS